MSEGEEAIEEQVEVEEPAQQQPQWDQQEMPVDSLPDEDEETVEPVQEQPQWDSQGLPVNSLPGGESEPSDNESESSG